MTMKMCFNSGRSYNFYSSRASTNNQSGRGMQIQPLKKQLFNQSIIAPFIGPRKPCGSCGGAR